jgi:hypothetical protein
LVETTLGTAVKVSKKEALKFIDKLEKRHVTPKVHFEEIYNGQYFVILGSTK